MADPTENLNLSSPLPRRVLVPSHIKNLNAVARAHGLAVSEPRIVREELVTGHSRSTSKDDEHLVGEWRGTGAQLRALGWILPSWSFPVATARGAGCKRLETKWGVDGYVHVPVSEDEVIFEIDYEDVPISISISGGVEAISLGWCVEYHGALKCLQDAGIAEKQRLGGRKLRKTNGYNPDEPRWWRLLQPDGSIVFGIETDLAWHQRMKENAHMHQSLRDGYGQNRAAMRFDSAEGWKGHLAYLLDGIPVAAERVLDHLGKAADRFQLDMDSALRIREILSRTHSELAQTFVAARVIDSQRAQLRLVVDNSP